MKTVVSILAISLELLSSTCSARAAVGKAVSVCGNHIVNEQDQHGLADNSVMTTFFLVIDEVAAPKSLKSKLIQYQSDVLRSLRLGKRYCVVGIEGQTTPEGRFIRTNLLNWVVVSE